LEACRGKPVFSGGSGVILKFLEWFEGLGAKTGALTNCGDFSEIFVDFGRVYIVLGPIYNYFSEVEGHAIKFTNGGDCGEICNKFRGGGGSM
jgi:hypothetical protein